jgi:hypothetical protein
MSRIDPSMVFRIALAIGQPNDCTAFSNDLGAEKGKYVGRIAQHSYPSADILPG